MREYIVSFYNKENRFCQGIWRARNAQAAKRACMREYRLVSDNITAVAQFS